ncbi:MAG: BlaI/MecI/CopY family transcriptional regulator [Oscillospiraceae bacterium]|jgi:BlaI family penicillinase repressor|nr:BlaI/MecI/CopY family transcriptional regulator [Oscillospiraceae bacterium]
MGIRIPEAELEIMRVLWREQRPMKVTDLIEAFKDTRGWNKSTIHTFVARMREKGIIETTERYGVARYVPCVTEDEYTLAEEKAVLSKFSSAKALALAMVRNGHLTDADIEELREYFKAGGHTK